VLSGARSRLSRALRTLHRPPPIQALRQMESALREPPRLDASLRTATDGLVDAVDTIDATLRGRVLSDR
jgi:hypothetical protein